MTTIPDAGWGRAQSYLHHTFLHADPEQHLSVLRQMPVRIVYEHDAVDPSGPWIMVGAERQIGAAWQTIEPSEWLYEWCVERFNVDATV